jgi:hypothetical protein
MEAVFNASFEEGEFGMVDDLLRVEAADLADESALIEDALNNTKSEKRKKRQCSMKIRWNGGRSFNLVSQTKSK